MEISVLETRCNRFSVSACQMEAASAEADSASRRQKAALYSGVPGIPAGVGVVQVCSQIHVQKNLNTKTVKMQENYKKWQIWQCQNWHNL